jgi:hypothetical protein
MDCELPGEHFAPVAESERLRRWHLSAHERLAESDGRRRFRGFRGPIRSSPSRHASSEGDDHLKAVRAAAYPAVQAFVDLAAYCRAIPGRGRRSATPPTGRNISATTHRKARAMSSSISIRSGRTRTSISSGSTTTCRSPTGAKAASISTPWPGGRRCTTSPICNRTSRAAKASTGSMPAPPTARRRFERPSPTVPPASRGCSATRT